MTAEYLLMCEIMPLLVLYIAISERRCTILHENGGFKASKVNKGRYYEIPQHVKTTVPERVWIPFAIASLKICDLLIKVAINPHHTDIYSA